MSAARLPRFLVLSLTLGLSPTARAHPGAVPAMLSLVPAPSQTNVLLAGTTFGALLSRDAGRSWRWICEDAYSPPTLVNPRFTFGPGGTLFVINASSLSISLDGGCDWREVPLFKDRFPSQVLVAAGEGGDAVYVATSAGSTPNGIYRSRNNAASFEAVLERDRTMFTALGTAASTHVLYASAFWYDPPASWILRSEDGAHWNIVAETGLAGPIRLLAVGTAHPNWLFILDSSGSTDRLMKSEDGGKTLVELLALPGESVNSLELSPDDGIAWLATGTILRRSQDGGHTFSSLPLPQHDVCVARGRDQILACGSRYFEGWEAAISDDGGDGWRPLLRFDQIAGPLDCPATTTAGRCGYVWPTLIPLLGIGGPDAGAPDAGPTTDAQGRTPTPTPTGASPGARGCTYGVDATVNAASMLATGLLVAARMAARRARTLRAAQSRRRRGA